MKIQWLGHSAFLLHGKNKVLIDPFLTGNPKAAARPEEIDCDIICVTHGHLDHLGDAVAIARRTGAEVACIVEMSLYLEKCSVKATGFNIGGTARIKDTKVLLTVLGGQDTWRATEF